MTLPYDDAVIQAVELTGRDFTEDARTVHKIILNNIHDDSDAYTYVKSFTKRRNGRLDINALRERYASNATKQTLINKAKTDLSLLRYKNERSFSFEKFSSKLQKCYDDLEANGRTVINGDIVDALWTRIQAPDLQQYIAALKVQYQQNPRDYKLILQDIAAEAGTKHTVSFAPGTRGISATYTKKGPCPDSRVFTSDGSVFIGSYDESKWKSESVRQYHKEILEAREDTKGDKGNGGSRGGGRGNGGKKSQGDKRSINAIKRNKKKLKTLKEKISAIQSKIDDVGDGKEDDGKDSPSDNARDAFGGKRSKKNK